jgi:hypothetical protein
MKRQIPALLLSVIGLAFLLATPAEAAKRKPRAEAATKQVYLRTVPPPQSTAVYFGSEYLGADPDPRIRHELLRDLGAHFGGNF